MEIHYTRDPSPLWSESADKLRALVHEEGLDSAKTAFAEAAHEEIERRYADGRSLRRAGGRRCIQRLLGRRCRLPNQCECRPPGDDHGALWLYEGKPFSYTFEPYGLDSKTLTNLIGFCQRHGLEPRIAAGSWHFPGECLLVEIRTPENWRRVPEA